MTTPFEAAAAATEDEASAVATPRVAKARRTSMAESVVDGAAATSAQKAVQAAEEEALAAAEPGPRDPMSIPDREFQEVVQSILATNIDDLASTTFGQLRGQVEARLGLFSGALASRKTLRRKVSRVVEDQISRRASRGPECDRVVRCILELEDYPTEVRQMLIDSLPNAVTKSERGAAAAAAATEGSQPGDEGGALAVTKALHPHQVRMLGIMRDALAEGQAREAVAEGALEAEVEAMKQALSTHKATCASATTHEVAAQASVESAKARAKDLEKELTSAQAQVSAAKGKRSRAASDSKELAARKSAGAALREGPLKALLDGKWRSDKERDGHISSVLAFLAEEGGDKGLAAALPTSLRKRPAARSSFDTLTAGSLVEFFAKRVGEMEATLATGLQAAADAELQSASAMLKATKDRATAQAERLSQAKAVAQAAAKARRTAEVHLAQQWSQTRELFARLDSAKAKVQDLEQSVALIDSWIAGGRTPGEVVEEEAKPKQQDEGQEDGQASGDGAEEGGGPAGADGAGGAEGGEGGEREGGADGGSGEGGGEEGEGGPQDGAESAAPTAATQEPRRSPLPAAKRAKLSSPDGQLGGKLLSTTPTKSPATAGRTRRASGAGLSPRGVPTPQR